MVGGACVPLEREKRSAAAEEKFCTPFVSAGRTEGVPVYRGSCVPPPPATPAARVAVWG